MTKNELVNTVAEKMNISAESAENAVLTTLSTIIYGLVSTGSVTIPRFGTFSVKDRPARQYRNPRTGETITGAAKRVVTFKPGKGVKEALR